MLLNDRTTAEMDGAAHAIGGGPVTMVNRHVAYPDVPLLIGGRDLGRAEDAATVIGGGEGVVLDLAADDLGLGERAEAPPSWIGRFPAPLHHDQHAAGPQGVSKKCSGEAGLGSFT